MEQTRPEKSLVADAPPSKRRELSGTRISPTIALSPRMLNARMLNARIDWYSSEAYNDPRNGT